MLVGRDSECSLIRQLLSQARLGQSGAMALVGEPGIGKTALLDYAAEHSKGMSLLHARGIESEAVVPFAGLLELVRPILHNLDRIPGPQADALATALALQAGVAYERFAVGAATLSLLAATAEDGPLLVILDDIHWLDGSSADAVLFAVRRLVADPIAVLLAAREGEPSLLDGSDIGGLPLAGLDRTATRALLAANAEESISIQASDRLHALTGGNPLALLEVGLESLSRGGQILDAIPVTTRTARAFLGRSRSLSEGTRRLLVLTAASDDKSVVTLSKAAELLDLEMDDLDAAERAGLVVLSEGSVQFRHPLVRSTIYSDAEPGWRRQAHRALASLSESNTDEHAWHLSAATTRPDDQVSAELENAAERAQLRYAYTEAASTFERAAHLSPDTSKASELLFKAADTAWLGGLTEQSFALVQKLDAQHPNATLTARIAHLRGHLAMRMGPVMAGHAALVHAAEAAAAAGDLEQAVAMLAEAANACFYAGDSRALALTAARANRLLPRNSQPRTLFLANVVRGMSLVIGGDGAEGTAHIRRALDHFEETSELLSDVRLLAWAVLATLWIRSSDTGSEIVNHAVAQAREQVAIGTLPYLLHHVARHQATSDHWTAASANYHEAIQLARETRQGTDLAAGLAGLAWLEARQGKDECVSHALESRRLCAELGTGIYDIWVLAALADLELGFGRAKEALDLLVERQKSLEQLGIVDADLSPAPELVEVQLRLGNKTDAVRAAEDFGLLAKAKGQPWAMARAERCKAMVASEEAFSPHFDRALELHKSTPDTFETARTRLLYGSRLRRSGQRVRSRQEIRIAVDLFDRLGATPWSKQASVELAATGESARRRNVETTVELTPQEYQVAQLLAGGSTTREAASALFISRKTVEYHVGHIYRKMQIHSRTELTEAMGTQE
jgi:DNA-binding CsgD family transcriptional regulator